jgi:hypothetical protein
MLPEVYIGVALDKANEKVILTTFVEGSEAEARRRTKKRYPYLPMFILRLFDKPPLLKNKFFAFLRENEVPDDKHFEIFGVLINGIKDIVEKEDDK